MFLRQNLECVGCFLTRRSRKKELDEAENSAPKKEGNEAGSEYGIYCYCAGSKVNQDS